MYRKGDLFDHRRTTRFKEQLPNGQDVVRLELRAIERTEVKDVNARGEATLVTACISIESMHDGITEPIKATSYPAATRVFAKNGLLIREIDAPDSGTDPLAIVDRLLLSRPVPPEPPETGTVWRTDLPDARRPGKRVTMVSRFLGPTNLAKIPGAKVATAFDVDPAPPRTEPIHVKREAVLDLTTGRTLHSKTEIRNITFASHGAIVSGTVDIEEELVTSGLNDKGVVAPSR
jgi:hypothetical protein